MSVFDNMAYGLKIKGLPKAEIRQRVDRAATMLQLEPYLARRPRELSGGQRQRVAIGRAIVREPSVFLFDEPLSNLDAALRINTRIEIAKLHRSLNATTIYVTHDQVEAMTLADRIVVINEQRIEQIGTPMEIYRRPASQFVASFVGTPRINLIAVQVSQADGKALARLPDASIIRTGIPFAGLCAGADMTLGLRAEAIRVGDHTADLRGTARVVERLGDRTLVHVALPDGTLLTAEDRGDSALQPGEAVGLAVDGGAAHLFAADGAACHAGAG
jgi:multiple sugar transport system ATP-binding protein